MMTSKKKQKLLDDSIKAGYAVTPWGEGGDLIVKKGRKHVKAGIVIFPDGKAYRVDVELSDTKAIKSYKEMRMVLGLQEN